MTVHTRETEFLTPTEMLQIVVDWTGGCAAEPGNADVLQALLDAGVAKERMVLLAHALAQGAWSRYAAAHLVMEMLSSSRVRAAVVRHGHLRHGLTLLGARRDVRTLRDEAREIVQREVLAGVKAPWPQEATT
jgi:hypothetical protein